MKELIEKIGMKEQEIQKLFETVKQKGIHKDVKNFHIEIFISQYNEIDAMLYSMDDHLNEVFGSKGEQRIFWEYRTI